jgi:hypothetical protein
MSETDKQKQERLKAERILKERERYSISRYGRLGPASAVRRIDPATGKVVEVIAPKARRRKKGGGQRDAARSSASAQ